MSQSTATKTSSITLTVSKSDRVTVKESIDFDGVAIGYVKDDKLHLIGIVGENETVKYKLDYKGKITSGSFTIKAGTYSEVISLSAKHTASTSTDGGSSAAAKTKEAHSSVTLTVSADDKVTLKESAHFDGLISGYVKSGKLHLVGVADENEKLSYKLDYKGKITSGSFEIKKGTYSEVISLPSVHTTATASAESASTWSIAQSLSAPQSSAVVSDMVAAATKLPPAVTALFDGAFGAATESHTAVATTPASIVAAAADTHHGLFKAV